jgi:stage III sporulation protein AG
VKEADRSVQTQIGERLFSGIKTSLRPVFKLFGNIPVGERGKILTLLVMMFVGVGLILLSGLKDGVPKTENVLSKKEVISVPADGGGTDLWAEERVENQLLSILGRIEGVGKVKVDLTYATSAEEEWLLRTQEEERKDQEESGGAVLEWRSEKEPVLRRQRDGVEEPIRVKTTAPRIAGVLVVAEGAKDAVIRERLWQAAATVLGVPMHRVIVVAWAE